MPRNTKGIETAEVISDRCIGCQICVNECPVGAIEISPDGTAVIDAEVCIGCGKCSDVCPVEAIRFERKRHKRETKIAQGKNREEIDEYSGVAVFIESKDGQGAEVSWELIGKAQELAQKLNTKVIGLLLGCGMKQVALEAASFGCQEVYLIDHPSLGTYNSYLFGKALTDLCHMIKPKILLIGATALGRDMAGVVATNLGTGLTADCTALDIEDETRLLLMTRPTFGGNIMATIFCEHRRPQMSTVRPKVFRMPEKEVEKKGRVFTQEWVPPEGSFPEVVKFIKEVPELGSIDIMKASALVVAGKGACDPEAMPLLEELARVVGGIVACSRPLVEAGLMPYERQVGQTGKTVAPKLYIGVGVSGAVQHLVGIQGAEKIVAINSDPAAPIFKVADVGLVGDFAKVVPVFVEEIKKRQQHAKDAAEHKNKNELSNRKSRDL